MKTKKIKKEMRTRELVERIRLSQEYRKKIIEFSSRMNSQLNNGKVDYLVYQEEMLKHLKGRKPGEWMRYYEDEISRSKSELRRMQRQEENRAARLFTLFALCLIVLGVFVIGSIKLGLFGYATLDHAEIISGKQSYEVGDMAHLFVIPSSADYQIEVYGPDGNLYASAINFPVDKEGIYNVKAVLSYGNETKEVSTSFEVVEKNAEGKGGSGETANETTETTANASAINETENTAAILPNGTENPSEANATMNFTVVKLEQNITKDMHNLTGIFPQAAKHEIKFSKNDAKETYEPVAGKAPIPVLRMEKEDVKIKIRGIGKNNLKGISFKDGVLHIDSMKIKDAEIEIPRPQSGGIMTNPSLYVKGDNETGFRLAIPYEKDGRWFNKVSVDDSHYLFNVEHFTDYNINSTGDYVTLSACLKNINNTADTCTITESGYYDIKKWLINSSDLNKSDNLSVAFDFDTNDNPTWDSSDQANNGTVGYGSVWNATGYYGGAYEFDAIESTCFINVSTWTWAADQPVTVSLWVKTAGCSGGCSAFGTDQFQAHIPWADNTLYWDYGANRVSTDFTPYLNKWTHVVLVSTGTDNTFQGIYINGRIIVSSASSSAPASITGLLIGKSVINGNDYYNEGAIDQFRIWNRTLSQAEIEQLYAGNVGRYNLSGNAIVLTNSTWDGAVTGSFLASLSPVVYNQSNYDQINPIWLSSACSFTSITADDKDVSAIADGTNDINCYAFNFTTDVGLGTGRIFICRHASCAYSCSALAGLGYGSCDCDNGVTWKSNGAYTNYTWQNETQCNFTIVANYKDPPYVRFNQTPIPRTGNITLDLNSSELIGIGNSIGISILNDNNTVRNAVLYNWTSGIYVEGQNNTIIQNTIDFSALWDINITGSYNQVYLNSFYSRGINDTGSSNLFCAAAGGNFYAESISSYYFGNGECGQANITRPASSTNYSAFINTTWLNQSSTRNLSYYIFYSNDSGTSWNSIARIYNISYYNWSIANLTFSYSYLFKVVPFDDSYNATNMNVTFGTIDAAPAISSVILNATSPDNLTSDNLTATAAATDPNGDNVELNYNWYRNGTSDTILNVPMTAPDSLNRTYDLSGNNNHGNVTNGAVWNATGGYNGFGAYQFDGVDDYIGATDNTLPSGSSARSVSLWIKTNSKLNKVIFHYGTDVINQNYYILLYDYNDCGGSNPDTGGVYSIIVGTDGAGNNLCGNEDMADGNWHHVVNVYDGSTSRLYLDGQLDDSRLQAPNTVLSGELRIGEEWSLYFNGTIDDVRIYNRSLSANEIGLLYVKKTNVTHSNATTPGDNWTVKVTPIDSYGLNGSSVFSNNLSILTKMFMNLVNQTPSNLPWQIVNETEPVNPNQNLMIIFNISNIGGTIDSVWIKIWQTVASAENVLWEGLMSLIGGLWQVEIPVDYSYPGGLVNYTVYANDTAGTTTSIEGNFSVNRAPIVTSVLLNATSVSHVTNDNLTAYASGVSDADGNPIELNYNWYKNGVSDDLLNMPMTALDWDNLTYDLSGNSYHGTVYGATWNRTAGYDGFGAYVFDGAEDYVDIPAIVSPVNYTIEMWLKPGSIPDNWTFVFGNAWNASNIFGEIYYYNNSGSNRFEYWQNGTKLIESADGMSPGSWTNLVFVHNNTEGRFYVNGVASGSPATFTSRVLSALKIAYTNVDDGSAKFNGTIDEVRIYRRSLSADEISLIYNKKTNVTHADATKAGENWKVKVTPIDYYGLEGASVISNTILIADSPPSIASVLLNATSSSNTTADNLTAYVSGVSHPDNYNVYLDYNWYRDGISEAALNMPFNAPDSNSKVYDFSGYNDHGTVVGSATWNRLGGHNGFGEFNFNGGYIQMSYLLKNVTNSFTMELWVKPSATHEIDTESANGTDGISGQKYAIFPQNGYSFSHSDTESGAGISIGTNGISVYEHGSNYLPALLVWQGDLNGWTQVVVVYDNKQPTLYVNGTYARTGLTSLMDYVYPGLSDRGTEGIGGGNYGPFQGAIDEVRVYNRTLSANEIRLLYEGKTNITHADATTRGENWTVKVTPIDSYGLNGTGVLSNGVVIINSGPSLTSVLLNATSQNNLTFDNLTANPFGASDPDNDSLTFNYNWFRNGVSDTFLNIPFTAPDSNNMTYDFSGNDYHGKVINATSAIWNATGGVDGFGAFQFYNSGYLNISNVVWTGGPVTVSLWVKATGDYDSSAFGAGYEANQRFQAHIPWSNNVLYWDYGDYTGNGRISTDFTPYLNNWTHVVLVSNGTNNNFKAIYLNGNLVASDATSDAPNINLTPFTIGGAGDMGGTSFYYFNGTIDDFRIWNRVLSANEIALLYENKTNVTHADTTNAGENWTVKVTPIDSYGLNGSYVFSNSLNVTLLLLSLLNQTSPFGEIITDTNPIHATKNLTIRFDVSAIGGGLQNVWIIVWQTVKSAANVLWQGVMSLLNGTIWQVEVPVNWSYPEGLVNYTIYANLTGGNVTEAEGSFNVTHTAYVNSSGGDFTTLTDCLFAVNNTGYTCILNQGGEWDINGTYSFNLSGTAIIIDSPDVVLDCNGTMLVGDGTVGDYGIYYYRRGGNITLRNCIMQGFGRNYYIDGYILDRVFVFNCIGIAGTESPSEYFLYGNLTMTNFTTLNSQATNLLSNQYSMIQDITLINSTRLIIAGESDTEIARANVSSLGGAGNIALDITDGTNVLVRDSTVDANGGIGAEIVYSVSGTGNVTLRNSTIKNGAVGIILNTAKQTIVNNTITNFTGQAIRWFASEAPDNQFINMTNNMIVDAGNTTSTSLSYSSYSPQNYTDADGNNINFSSCVQFFDSAMTGQVIVTSDDTEVSHATGLNNYSLWLIQDDDSPALGCGAYANATLFVDGNMPYSCPFIAGYVGGVCYLEWKNAFNGTGVTGNYTWDSSVNSTTMTGYTMPYLAAQNFTIQSASPIEVRTFNNWGNITGNIIRIDDGRTIVNSMNITEDSTGGQFNIMVWLNQFYSGQPVSTGNTIYCNEGEGNFYEESLTPMAGDCGQSNVTYPNGWPRFNFTSPYTISWTKQSSIKTVTYEIFANKTTTGGKTRLGNTTALDMLMNGSLLSSGNYTIIVIPWVNGSRINATHGEGGNFTINSAPSLTSAMLNATSPDNLTSDNLTAHAYGISDPDSDIVELNYNWQRNGVSDTALNMPMTAPDRNNMTYDLSGNDKHGTVYGAAWNRTGGYNGFGAFIFNGLGDFINASAFNWPAGSPVTVSLWVKSAGGTNGSAFGVGNNTINRRFQVYIP